MKTTATYTVNNSLKMFTSILCVLFLVQTEVSCMVRCEYCVNHQCPEIGQSINAASCRIDRSDVVPKICCSTLELNRKSDEMQVRELTLEEYRIDNHENLKLLPERCGAINGDKIVGGQVAGLYEFPWMALIARYTADGNKFNCGGTIINKRYVLTAAHCLSHGFATGVRVGEYDIEKVYDCQNGVCEHHIQDLPIERIVINEREDIALIRVGADIDFDHLNVDVICLPTTSQLRHSKVNNENGMVTGWGLTENYTYSPILRKVVVPIHSPEQCHVGKHNSEYYLCAGAKNKDSCNRDSGGPLMLQKKIDHVFRYVQYGIVASGPIPCGQQNNPGIYTDVTKFMGWILDNISP